MKKSTLVLILSLVFAVVLLWPHLQRLYFRIDFEPEILKRAEELDLDPHLIAAQIFTESRFDVDARSEAGAMGLMQLMPETAAELATEEQIDEFETRLLYQGELNIRLGTLYLAKLLMRFKNERMALAAYNAGPTQVQKWTEDDQGIAFPETRAYVDNVLRTKEKLKILYPSWPQPGVSSAGRETLIMNPTP